MKEPDFIIGGSTTSGIKALMNVLNAHHQIMIPSRREDRYFFSGRPIKRPIPRLSEKFDDVVGIRINRQIPRSRILHGEDVFEPKIASLGAPHAKIIFTLRNPVLRAYMQYHNAKAKGKERASSFEQTIEEEIFNQRTPRNSANCWIYKNQYQKHLNDWLSYYPREKIMILIVEEWSVNPHTPFTKLEEFLGLPANSLSMDDAFARGWDEKRPLHEKLLPKTIDYPPMLEKTQRQLEDLFRVDIGYVENFLGRKILSWTS